MPTWRNSLLLTWLLLPGLTGRAQHLQGDTVASVSLESVVVSSGTKGGALRSRDDGSLVWDMSMIEYLPRILGVADPMHYSQMLPGVSVNSEYDAGFRVHGCESGHNQVSLNGVPVYGAAHLLGIFSVFTPSHYGRVSLSKEMSRAAMPNRIGATIDLRTTDTPPRRLTGEATAGLIESGGTLDIPTGKQSHLLLSLRASYINLLYAGLLRNDEMSMHYSFYDTNLSYSHTLGDDVLTVDAYWGLDDASYHGRKLYSDVDMKWGNGMVSLGWLHPGERITTTHKAYFTRYHADDALSSQSLKGDAEASIAEWGYKGNVRSGAMEAGVDVSAYRIRPQGYHVDASFEDLSMQEETAHATELSAYVDYRTNLARRITAACGLRAAAFGCEGKWYGGGFPSAELSYKSLRGWDVTLGYSYRKQFLTQTGLSSLGSPLEYWVCSGMAGLRPQSSHSLLATFRYSTPDGGYTVVGEAYTKWLRNQVEFNGTIFAMLSSDYSLANALLVGKGINYGFNVMVMKNHGAVTGWMSYGYSPAKRTFHTAQLTGTFHSSHERLHELKAVAAVKAGERTTLGVTMVAATGTPYTRPKSLMMMGRRVLPVYDSYNGSRLAHYFRLDLSTDYCLKRTQTMEHGLNLSIYNCTGRKNELFWYVHADDTHFNYRSMKNIMSMLPSLSYTVKF